MVALALPDVPFQPSYPRLQRQVSTSRSGDRVVATVEYGDPFWTIDMVTVPLRPARRLAVEAFIDSCRGGLRTVLYTPKHSCLPKAYWGNPTATEIATDGELDAVSGHDVTISNVTNGLVLTAGDLISMTTGDYHSLFRVEVGSTASGGEIDVTLNMPVPSWISVGASVRFKDPRMNMRLLPGSFSMADAGFPVASFSLFQVPK